MKFNSSQLAASRRLILFSSFLFSYLTNHKEHTMKYWSNWYRSALAGLALLAGLGLHATTAFGQAATADFLVGGTVTSGGISANTDISNTATLNYQINGTNQPAVSPAVAAQFKVDKIVNLTVTRVTASHVAVAPSATAQVIQFTVTNTGNGIEDFQLTAANMATATSILIGATTYTDGFDSGVPTACTPFVESGVNPAQYDAGPGAGKDVDKAIASLSPVTGSNQKTVWMVCDIPNVASGDSLVSLTAQAFKATTCTVATGACTTAETASAGVENPSTVETVLNDGAAAAPLVPGDAVKDGKAAAVGVYRIVNSSVQVTKAIVTICDPVNFSTNPRAIPGAFVRYTITIANFTALPIPTASATLTQITDSLNVALLNFDNNFVQGSVSAVPPANCTTPESAGNAYNVKCNIAAGSGVTNTRTGACVTAAGQFFPNGGVGAALNFASPTITALLNLVLPAVGAPTCPTGGTPNTAGNYCAGELKPGEQVQISFNSQIK